MTANTSSTQVPIEAPSDIASPTDRCHVAADESAGSFNEDLAWIVRQYRERTGAAGVAVTVHHVDSGVETVEAVDLEEGPPHDAVHELRWLGNENRTNGRRAAWPRLGWHEPTAEFPWLRLTVDLATNQQTGTRISGFYPPGSVRDRSNVEVIALRFQPVLTGYFKLWLLHRSTSRRLQTIIAALAHVDFGVVVLDKDARIVFENPAATKVLDDGRALHRCRGSICAKGSVESVSLRVAVDRALSGGDAGEAMDATSPVIFVKPGPKSSPVVAAVTPVDDRLCGHNDRAVLVHIFDPALSVDRAIAPICEWYGLSAMETRLVTMLVTGKSVVEMAAREAIKQDTARTYLKNVFRKTGTKNQADLVRLMMTNPIRLRRAGKVARNPK